MFIIVINLLIEALLLLDRDKRYRDIRKYMKRGGKMY